MTMLTRRRIREQCIVAILLACLPPILSGMEQSVFEISVPLANFLTLLVGAEQRDYELAVRSCDDKSKIADQVFLGRGLEVATEISCEDPSGKRFALVRENQEGITIEARKENSNDEENVPTRCYRSSQVFGRTLSRLELSADGVARAEYDDGGTVMHAATRSGFVHGPALFADAAGLATFGRVVNGAPVGRTWSRREGGIVVFSGANDNRVARSLRDLDSFVVKPTARDGGGRAEFYAGRLVGMFESLVDVTLNQDYFRPAAGCFLDFEDAPTLTDKSDLIYSLTDMRLHSTEVIMKTCNGFGGAKSGKEALDWIENTYFSVDRDTLRHISPFSDDNKPEENGEPIFTEVRRDGERHTVKIGGKKLFAR